MEDHHWDSQGWNSAVEPQEEDMKENSNQVPKKIENTNPNNTVNANPSFQITAL
jgi:hypothetical protein